MTVQILAGDCRVVLPTLPDRSIDCVVTSPPYFGLRDYKTDGQIGLEPTPDEYVGQVVEVFREVRRVLRDDGTLWLNLGDSYAATTKGSSGVGKNATNRGTIMKDRSWAVPHGLKPKDLIGIPWRVAFALQADGWYLRQDIIWSKPNPMPESVTDRCTKAHEYIFLMAKSARYHYDAAAIAEPWADERNGASGAKSLSYSVGSARRDTLAQDGRNGLGVAPCRAGRNRRSVWTVTTQPFSDAHFATFPPDLVEPCILAGCRKGGTVLDPFGGAGTTGLVADRHGRNAVLIEINPEYVDMARRRIVGDAPLLADVQT